MGLKLAFRANLESMSCEQFLESFLPSPLSEVWSSWLSPLWGTIENPACRGKLLPKRKAQAKTPGENAYSTREINNLQTCRVGLLACALLFSVSHFGLNQPRGWRRRSRRLSPRACGPQNFMKKGEGSGMPWWGRPSACGGLSGRPTRPALVKTELPPACPQNSPSDTPSPENRFWLRDEDACFLMT